ncbi:MAG: rhombotarget lipoprotein, partial [Woeseiaceae bacterium]
MRTRIFALALITVVTLSGCHSLFFDGYERTRQGASSSLVDYLYPDGEVPADIDQSLPQLNLPLRVGIGFVPSRSDRDFSAAHKERLLRQVAEAFQNKPYVASITTVPESYLRSSSGLLGMRQVASMFSVDAIALVSYDQLTISSERDSAILYWTVVGAMAVKGTSNEVQTMIDTAVFDSRTGQLLFRAPGLHSRQKNTTYADQGRDTRKLRMAGFDHATAQMIGNLDQELTLLKTAIKRGDRAEVTWKEGSGGGSVAMGAIGFLLAMLLVARWRR